MARFATIVQLLTGLPWVGRLCLISYERIFFEMILMVYYYYYQYYANVLKAVKS
jgi:hypothetical protein